MGIVIAPELGGEAQQRAARCQAQHQVDMRIVTEERNIFALGQHRDPGSRMSVPNDTKQRRGKENVSDGAEAECQDIWNGGGVGHGLTVNGEG
jgi:hypothetical protein